MSPSPRGAHQIDPWSTDRLLAVGLGAAAGALLRVWVGGLFPTTGDGLPLGTVVINVTGCLLMGLVTPALRRAHPLAALAVTTGVLGGYTTFSTFSLDALHLAEDSPVTMLAYLALTLVGCLVGVTAGLLAGERLVADAADDADGLDEVPRLDEADR